MTRPNARRELSLFGVFSFVLYLVLSIFSPALSIMDISFALTGKGYVIVAADTTAARSIVKMKVDEDKIKVLSPHLLMAYSGEPGIFSPTLIGAPV